MSRYSTPPTAVPPTLATADFVFIRKDSHRPPFTPPYEGPFRVLRRRDKGFEVDVGGRKENVSSTGLSLLLSIGKTRFFCLRGIEEEDRKKGCAET